MADEGGKETQNEPPNTSVTTPNKATSYSGMAAATRKDGLGTPATIIQELIWQRSVGGDLTKINQWKEVMGSLQEFKAYMFVKQGNCFATVMHSPIKFAAISAATGHLQGRIIGFIGDRTSTREPTPILLPQRKTWERVKETVNTDGPALLKHYANDPARIGTLWKGEGGDEDAQAELHASRLIAIPLWLLDCIRQEGRALMPCEILRIVVAHLEADNTAAYADAWATIAHWCILASQGTTAGESLVSFAIEAVTEVEDEYLGKWLEQRLDTTRGGPAGPMTQATFAADAEPKK